MATLDELMAGLRPAPEELDKGKWLALLGASAGLLGARRGQTMQGLSQGLLGGIQMSQQYEDNLRKRKLGELQARNLAMDSLTKEDAFNENQKFNQALSSYKPQSPMQQAMAAAPSLSPTVANVAQVTGNAQSIAQNQGVYEKLIGMADYLESKGLPKRAMEYRTLAEKYAPQYDKLETQLDAQGNPVTVQTYKNRAPQTLPGYQPPPQMTLENLGGSSVAIDKLRVKPGDSWVRTLSPDAQLSANTTMRGQDMTDARMREQNIISSGDKQISQVHTIRKELNALPDVQGYRAALPMLESAKRAPDTRAGDLDVIYAVGKALDPGSVVREGELNLVIKSGTLPQQIEGMLSYVMGGGKLAPAQRAELIAMLQGRVAQLRVAHDAASAPFIKQATAAGLPLDQIVTPFGDPLPPGVPLGTAPNGRPAVGNFSGTAEERAAFEARAREDMRKSGGGAPSSGPPKMATQADIDRLPSGTVYIAPDGSMRRKK